MRTAPSLKILASHVLTRTQRPIYEIKNLLPLSLVPSLSDDFEERLAIAEHDGQQSPAQTQRIAYQEAFISILTSLPLEGSRSVSSPREWLQSRIQEAQSFLDTPESILFTKDARGDKR